MKQDPQKIKKKGHEIERESCRMVLNAVTKRKRGGEEGEGGLVAPKGRSGSRWPGHKVPRESGRGAEGSTPGPAPTSTLGLTSVRPPRRHNCVAQGASVWRLVDSRFVFQNNLGHPLAHSISPRPALSPRPSWAPATCCLCRTGPVFASVQQEKKDAKDKWDQIQVVLLSVSQGFDMQILWRESPVKKDGGGGAALLLWFSGPWPREWGR